MHKYFQQLIHTALQFANVHSPPQFSALGQACMSRSLFLNYASVGLSEEKYMPPKKITSIKIIQVVTSMASVLVCILILCDCEDVKRIHMKTVHLPQVSVTPDMSLNRNLFWNKVSDHEFSHIRVEHYHMVPHEEKTLVLDNQITCLNLQISVL